MNAQTQPTLLALPAPAPAPLRDTVVPLHTEQDLAKALAPWADLGK